MCLLHPSVLSHCNSADGNTHSNTENTGMKEVNVWGLSWPVVRGKNHAEAWQTDLKYPGELKYPEMWWRVS